MCQLASMDRACLRFNPFACPCNSPPHRPPPSQMPPAPNPSRSLMLHRHFEPWYCPLQPVGHPALHFPPHGTSHGILGVLCQRPPSASSSTLPYPTLFARFGFVYLSRCSWVTWTTIACRLPVPGIDRMIITAGNLEEARAALELAKTDGIPAPKLACHHPLPATFRDAFDRPSSRVSFLRLQLSSRILQSYPPSFSALVHQPPSYPLASLHTAPLPLGVPFCSSHPSCPYQALSLSRCLLARPRCLSHQCSCPLPAVLIGFVAASRDRCSSHCLPTSTPAETSSLNASDALSLPLIPVLP